MKNLTERFARLVPHIHIHEVRLVECHVHTSIHAPGQPGLPSLSIHPNTRAWIKSVPDKSGAFHVLAEIDVRVVHEGSQRKPFVQVRGVFELRYNLNSGIKADRANLASFARVNSVFNAWPYFRELVQSMTVRMGLPPIYLPLFKFMPSGNGPGRRKKQKVEAKG